MTKALNILLLLFLSSMISLAQNVRFEASVDARKIIQNSTVNVEFTIHNAEGQSFTPPKFNGFRIVGGPNRSTQMSFVNGKNSSKKSYGYALMATKLGKFRIGAATIEVDSKKYQTEPITIEVVKADPKSMQASEEYDFFVKAILSDSIAIIGQQVVLNYTLYTRIDIQNYDLMNESDYDGFFSVPLEGRRERAQREIIDNKEYYVQSLKKVALFPQQTGTYEFDPVVINLGIRDGSRRNSFFQRNTKKIQRTTNTIKIQVIANPPNEPLSYSGGVGSYDMNAQVDKKTITTDDAIKITMIIKGSGDAKIVTAPKQDFDQNLEVYEPNILSEDQMVDKGFVSSQKIFEYLVVPKKTGQFTIQPKFSYYSPDSNRYETLTAGPFLFNVAQGMKAINTMEAVKSDKVLFPLIASPTFVSKPTILFGSVLHWGLLGLILAAIPFLFMYKLKLRKEANIDPRLIQAQNAEKVAIAKLSVAKSLMKAGSIRQFYEEIQNGIFGYLSDRLEVPYSQMNKSDINKILTDKNVPQDFTDRVSTILQKAEMALFANAGSVGMQESYNGAKELILGLEVHFKR